MSSEPKPFLTHDDNFCVRYAGDEGLVTRNRAKEVSNRVCVRNRA